MTPTLALGGGIKIFKFSRAKKLPPISHVLPNLNFNPLEIVVLYLTSQITTIGDADNFLFSHHFYLGMYHVYMGFMCTYHTYKKVH
jgi:hypothetical protein